MDGTLVEYRRDCNLSLLKTKGYFASLKPEWNMIEAMLKLNKDKNSRVFILTKVYPNVFPYSVKEKKEYISKYIPDMVDKTIMVNGDVGETKSGIIKQIIGKFDQDCVLVDDFTKNLTEWEREGGVSIKYLNGINNTNGTVHRYSVSCYMSAKSIYEYLKNINTV